MEYEFTNKYGRSVKLKAKSFFEVVNLRSQVFSKIKLNS